MLKKRRFEKMYTTYADDIFRYLLAHTRDVQLAEDLTADTFVKVWNKLTSFDGKHERGWLYKIAQNLLTDHWRRKQAVPLDEEIEIADERAGVEEVIDKTIEQNRIYDAIATLKEPMHSVVLLRFMQGYSARETADALGLTEANVRVVQYRALKKLKEVLA